jgi:hypothetical protein
MTHDVNGLDIKEHSKLKIIPNIYRYILGNATD